VPNATLPGTTEEGEPQIIAHVDIDCFYAACERLREPELEGEPVVVGMGYEPDDPGGAVATASYEAREHGVESAQPIEEALEVLPRAAEAESDAGLGDEGESNGVGESPDEQPVGYYRPVDMEFYESVAADVKTVLDGAADTLREVSIDEAYLDVTERTTWDEAADFAGDLKARIADRAGVTASVGVAPTMSAAKIASDHDKPDGLVVVRPGEVASFLAPLDVADVHGVGPVRAGELRDMGIETVADLADADPDRLADHFGSRGRELVERARGDDDRAVEPMGRPESLSRESALADPATGEPVRERVQTLAAAVADRARRKGALYRTVGVKVVVPPFDINTRERSLSGPVDDPDLVERTALDLLEEVDSAPVRKVGVRVSNLSFTDRDQGQLGQWEGDATAEDPTAGVATAVNDSAVEGSGPHARRDRVGQTTLFDFIEVARGSD
jgi:DNA polymerase IV (DinB-like DNA polymerase)